MDILDLFITNSDFRYAVCFIFIACLMLAVIINDIVNRTFYDDEVEYYVTDNDVVENCMVYSAVDETIGLCVSIEDNIAVVVIPEDNNEICCCYYPVDELFMLEEV